MTDSYIGEIRILPYTYAPFGWAYCNGQILPIAQNQVLYAVIGAAFGGNWRTTMGVPNLIGRAPMGTGNGVGLSPRTLADMGGSNGVILSHQYLPSHTHATNAYNSSGDQTDPSSTLFGAGVSEISTADGTQRCDTYHDPDPDMTDMAYEALAEAGLSYPHENRQPSLGIAFCLALEGVFPSRN